MIFSAHRWVELAVTRRAASPAGSAKRRSDWHPSARRAVPTADFGGIDPATGRQLILTGSAATEADAFALRDGFRKQVADHTAVRTNVTLQVLLAEWLAGQQVEPGLCPVDRQIDRARSR